MWHKSPPVISEIQACKNLLGCFAFFFLCIIFLSVQKNCHNTRLCNPIGLKFGTHEKTYRAYLSTKFGLNTNISGWAVNDYSHKNNTNMLSRLQGEQLTLWNWKSVGKLPKHQTSNLLWFGRNERNDCSNNVEAWQLKFIIFINNTLIEQSP